MKYATYNHGEQIAGMPIEHIEKGELIVDCPVDLYKLFPPHVYFEGKWYAKAYLMQNAHRAAYREETILWN